MAGVAPRTILVCAFPAVLSLLTFLWIRKKKKTNTTIEPTDDAADSSEKSLETRTRIQVSSRSTADNCSEELPVAIMHVKDQTESKSDLLSDLNSEGSGDGSRVWGKIQLQMKDENRITCGSSGDKIEDSVTEVANHLAKLTATEVQGINSNSVDSLSNEAALKDGHSTDSTVVNEEPESSNDPISEAEGKVGLNSAEFSSDSGKLSSCETSPSENVAPDIVIQTAHDESHANSDFILSDLKLFDVVEEQEIQTSITVGSFDSVNYSEMDDLTDSPPHSTYSDVQSEGSSDSGKGGSDIQAGSDLSQTTVGDDSVLIYEFELPQDLCGRLIGRLGRHVNFIKSRSGANVFIKRHLFNPRIKICAVEGNQSEIKNALELIRKRFPTSQFPNVNFTQVNVPVPCGVMVPETLQLHLPEGVTSDVILSSMVSAGHFFVQQPTHPTYPSLNRLDQCMTVCYSQMETPELPHPVEVGVICAAPMMGGWYRASVVHVYENSEECDVKFVDYGGYSCSSISSLRQIRSDFMTLPFQASECYLANVKPPDDSTGWSLEACATFEELAQGQILQLLIVAHADDGVPYVHLYRIQGVSTIFINRELVNRGIAQWVEHQV